jgi:hypothetical protein
MDLDTAAAVILVVCLLYFSLNFDRKYGNGVHDAARHPFARFLVGMGVAILAGINPILAILGLIIAFFWIADVTLLSSISL